VGIILTLKEKTISAAVDFPYKKSSLNKLQIIYP
jgi:hypothetical protein